MSLIIPSAGLSLRFPDKPKWLLTSPNGNLMIQECITGLDLTNINDIYITILEQHYVKYINNLNIEHLFKFTNKNIHVLKLKHVTRSQSETVYNTIKHFNINGPIFIKDCDNYFEFKIEIGNYVCCLEVNNNNNVEKLHNKSFIEINNNNNNIINIIEKKIIGNIICIGGYSFISAKLFITNYKEIININNDLNEIYISNIVFNCIINKIEFCSKSSFNYIDWGTIDDWKKYINTFKTLFIDIDGTLFYNCGQYSETKWGDNLPITNNIEYINNLYKNNRTQIILTTARKYEFKDVTISQLKKYNINYHDIIFDLFHCKRYLINDWANTNPYPSAVVINLERDSDNLNKLL